jgi:hypothetical protein
MTDPSVADLAHQLWIARGRPEGSAEIDWFEAERLLGVPREGGSQKEAGPSPNERVIDASLAATFPASDPPASHTPDLPPANAADKWAAAAAVSHGDIGEG